VWQVSEISSQFAVRPDAVMAHVVVRVGDNLIESAITRRSADELRLKKGDIVVAIIKSTEVTIQKD
jgi:molybdopterin-binding protein